MALCIGVAALAVVLTRGSRPALSLTGSGGSVRSVAFSPDGKILAAGDDVGTTYLWNPATGQLLTTLRDPGRQASADAVAFSPDGKALAISEGDGRTYLWDVAAGTSIATMQDPGSAVAVAFSPDGRTLAVAEGGAYAGSAGVWDIATGKLIASFSDPSRYAISSVAFSPDGKALAGGDNYDASQPATIPARTYVWDVGGLP